MKPCLLPVLPKKYLHTVERNGEKCQIYVTEPTHKKILEILKQNPEAKLIIKEG